MEYFAVLNLLKVKTFEHSSKSASDLLGIGKMRARNVVDDLVNAGMLDISGKKWQRTHSGNRTSEDTLSSALQKSHIDELNLLQQRYLNQSLSQREFTSATLGIRNSDLPEAKKMMRLFRDRFCKNIESDPADAVYLLAMQLLPLTNSEEESP